MSVVASSRRRCWSTIRNLCGWCDSTGIRPYTKAPERSTVDFGFKDVSVDDKEPLVGKVFSNVAPKYDIMNDVMSVGMHRLWKDHFVAKLSPYPGMQHLDVAGGTGDITFRILEKLRSVNDFDGQVTCLDINEKMIAEGKKKADKLKLTGPHLKWVVASAEDLPLQSESVDSYTVAFGIRNVTNRDAALAEAYRVLRRGGRFLCLEFTPVDTPVLKELYDTYSLHIIPKLGKAIAGDDDSYRYLVESIRRFPRRTEFAEQIQDAGFRFVDFELLSGGLVAIHSGFKL